MIKGQIGFSKLNNPKLKEWKHILKCFENKIIFSLITPCVCRKIKIKILLRLRYSRTIVVSLKNGRFFHTNRVRFQWRQASRRAFGCRLKDRGQHYRINRRRCHCTTKFLKNYSQCWNKSVSLIFVTWHGRWIRIFCFPLKPTVSPSKPICMRTKEERS